MMHKGKLKKVDKIYSQGSYTLVHRQSQIPIVESYKYLGIMIAKNLNFRYHLNYIKEKIKRPQKIIDIMK